MTPEQIDAELANERRLVIARIAAHKPDDGEPVTEEWLPISAMGIADSKRLGYIVASNDVAEIVYCPACGELPPVLCVGSQVVVRNPTRGDVRRLTAVLGITLRESP